MTLDSIKRITAQRLLYTVITGLLSTVNIYVVNKLGSGMVVPSSPQFDSFFVRFHHKSNLTMQYQKVFKANDFSFLHPRNDFVLLTLGRAFW